MSNYPVGAMYDVNAPWNQKDVITADECPRCGSENVFQAKSSIKGLFYNKNTKAMQKCWQIREVSICRDCFKKWQS